MGSSFYKHGRQSQPKTDYMYFIFNKKNLATHIRIEVFIRFLRASQFEQCARLGKEIKAEFGAHMDLSPAHMVKLQQFEVDEF